MPITVKTDVSMLMASKSSVSNTATKLEAMERLTSGKRINSAKDDAAGVAMASRLTSSVVAHAAAIRNVVDAQSMIDTGEGAMIEVENILQRMRELSVQSANGTNSSSDRAMIQVELDQLRSEIDRIAVSTQWAGQGLFNGTNSPNTLATDHTEKLTAKYQIGATANDADNITVDFNAITAEALGIAGDVKSPTLTVSNPSGTSTNVIETSGSGTSGTIEIKSGFVAGDTYSLKINGTTVSITATDADGFENSTSGLNQQLAARVNTLAHPVTGKTLGFNAAYNSSTGKVDIEYTAPVVTSLVQDSDDTEDGGSLTVSPVVGGTRTSAGTTATFADTTAGRTYGLSVNGTAFTFTPTTTDAYADTALGYAQGAKAALEAALATAEDTGVTVAAAVDGDGDPTLTITSNLTFADATSTATSTSATLTYAAEGSTPSLGERVTVNGTPINGDVFSITIDGKTLTVTYSDSDGYANSGAGLAAQLVDKIKEADISGLTVTDNGDGTFDLAKGGALSVSSESDARAAITALDAALTVLNKDRANFGALSNRLSSAMSNLTNVRSNTEISLGRLQDADFAEETSKLTTTQILEQASIAMMAQANAAKQNVLQLLG